MWGGFEKDFLRIGEVAPCLEVTDCGASEREAARGLHDAGCDARTCSVVTDGIFSELGVVGLSSFASRSTSMNCLQEVSSSVDAKMRNRQQYDIDLGMADGRPLRWKQRKQPGMCTEM